MLPSSKLKSFWFSISDEPLPTLDFLSAALLSAEYERALGRALAMPECRLIPFFGAFLRELSISVLTLVQMAGAAEVVDAKVNVRFSLCLPTGLYQKEVVTPSNRSRISDEPLPTLDFLSAALLSAEYERALGRALAMPECRLIPFFGAFLRELRFVHSNEEDI
ncbi:unnamed protein product [Plutella xylostella]|uniref:(diamondback moth) hypothetical protein n=1 Tax=Plutella xylostella TaxID=51655 RepID=A0A8S4FVX5_PLUXY|nr:unnamed protein product [Plutella xylostella]